MTAKKMFRALAVTLMLALVLTTGVFATENTVTVESGDVVDTVLSAPAADTTGAEAGAETGDATGAETGDATGAETGAETGDTTGAEAEAEKDGISTGTVIGWAIVIVILIAAIVFCIKNREKVAKFFREVKSELKKIVWTPWKQVKKNTFVVLVIVLICAAVIALCDFAFSKGIIGLGDAIRGLFK